MNLLIDLTDIEDMTTLGNSALIKSIFDHAKEVIDDGGKIIIERRYTNAPSDKLVEFATIQEIENWKSRIEEVIKKIASK